MPLHSPRQASFAEVLRLGPLTMGASENLSWTSALVLLYTAARFPEFAHTLGLPSEDVQHALERSRFDPRLLEGQLRVLEQHNPHLYGLTGLLEDPKATWQVQRSALAHLMFAVESTVARIAEETPGMEGVLRVGEAFTALLEGMGRSPRDGASYTPASVAALGAGLLEVTPEMSVLDPACGQGHFFVAIAARLRALGQDTRKIHFVGHELNAQLVQLSKVHLLLNGIFDFQVEQRDSLRTPLSFEESSSFDRIISDPPFGQVVSLDPSELERDSRFVYTGSLRRSSEWLFIQHGLSALKPGGRAVFFVPNGPLFREGQEARARTALTERGYLSSVMGLPSALYPYVSIPFNALVLERTEPGQPPLEPLFVDAGTLGTKEGRLQTLSFETRERLLALMSTRAEEAGVSRRVTRAELQKEGFLWQPSHYVQAAVAPPQVRSIKDVRQDLEYTREQLELSESRLIKALETLEATLEHQIPLSFTQNEEI